VACGPSPEERLLSFDMVSRSAEALKRLKPQELRALWLRAEGVLQQLNPERRTRYLRVIWPWAWGVSSELGRVVRKFADLGRGGRGLGVGVVG